MPSRIQRRRAGGWRAPEGAVYVGRGSVWGNPWRVDPRSAGSSPLVVRSRAEAAARYCEWLTFAAEGRALAALARERLRGRTLMCWCPEGAPCHGDFLVDLADTLGPGEPGAALGVGSVCSGYGGLEVGLEEALGPVRTAWVADTDEAAARVLAARFPWAPNLGDIRGADFTSVERVDIIAGGTPCQDLSHAGRRAGMTPESRSGLWASMARAVEEQEPALVVWENVEGARTSGADRGVGRGGGGVATRDGGTVLRAAGRVVGDLSSLGYDCQWSVVSAASVGAPHRRRRLFVLGVRRTASTAWLSAVAARADALRDADLESRDMRGVSAPGEAPRGRTHGLAGGPGRAPAPHLIPTPTASDHKECRHSPGTGMSLSQAVELMPTPTTQDIPYSSGGGYGATLGEAVRAIGADASARRFGPYTEAVRRWEALTRAAPAPTEPSPRSARPRLSAEFVEWLMGLEAGWVTSPELGLSRRQQLRLLGNGIVPQQAAAVVGGLLGRHLRAQWGLPL